MGESIVKLGSYEIRMAAHLRVGLDNKCTRVILIDEAEYRSNIMKDLGMVGWVAMILVIVGALNWGLVGAFNFDLVATIFGHMSMLARVVYIVVGVAALYMLYTLFGGKTS